MSKFQTIPCSEIQCRVYLSLIKKGDEKALEALYSSMKYPIFLFAISYCKNRQTAEDILQDTFIKLICNISQYKELGHARTWIFTIVKNLCLDTLAKQKISVGTLKNDSEPDFSALEVQEALDTLSVTESSVIRLSVFAGLKLNEIASILKLPIGKVRYAKRSARKKLILFYSLQNEEGEKAYEK